MNSELSDPIGDPFLDAVRGRHPDVDFVLLPPEPESPPAPPADRETAVAMGQAVLAEADRLWDEINTQALTERPALVYSAAGRSGTVRCAARVLVAETRHGVQLMSGLRQAVPWLDLRVGPVSWLEGRIGTGRLRASYAADSGFFQLELTSPAVQVGAQELDALRGEG